jgi:MFS family permease
MHKKARGYSVAFCIALTANVFFFFSFQGTFPVLPRFIAEVVVRQPPEAVAGQVGLASTVLALVSVLTRIPAGQLADRFGRRRFLFAGAICFTLAPLIYIVSRDMPTLLLGRVVHGLGLAMFTTAFQALVTDLSPPERRGEALGLAGASVSVAFMSAPVVGDWLATALGYTPFFVMNVITAVVSILLVMLISVPPNRNAAPVTGEPESNFLADLRLTLAQKGMRAGVLTMAALGIPFGAFITFVALFAEEQQVTGVGSVFSIYAGTSLLAQPLAGWLSDKVGRRGMILPGLAITTLATLILSFDGSLAVFILAGIVFGLGGGLARGGVDALVQDSVPPTLRGTAAAVQYTSFDFWIGLGSYPVGLLANAIGYAATFVASGIFCLLGSGFLAAMLWGKKSEGQKANA